MQSFIQYRRFRTQVERQYQSKGEKVAVNARDGQRPVNQNTSTSWLSTASSSSESSLSRSDEDKTKPSDLENGNAVSHHLPDHPNTQSPRQHHALAEAEAEASESLQNDLKNRPTPPGDGHLSKTTTHATHHSQGTALGRALTGIQVRRRQTHEGGHGQVFVVGYQGENDPNDPHNWSYTKRIFATTMIAAIGFVVGVASAIDSSALREAAAEFGVSEVTESLATGLYLIGFGAGALFAGPFSETLGRNPYVPSNECFRRDEGLTTG